MGETLTVRLFVSTQTYDIPCDPRQPAKWLLQQAKNIQRSNLNGHTRAKNEIQDELEVLYNRSRRLVIDLDEPIGRCISPMDVIDARTLLQTPDTSINSTMFPWLRSYPGGPHVNDDNLNSANGLFFQQLYAYTLIGRRTPQTATQRRQKQKQDEFLDLLKAYVVGSFEELQPQIEVSYAPVHNGGYNNGSNGYSSQVKPQPSYYTRPLTPPAAPTNSALHGMPACRASELPASKGFFSSASSQQTTTPVSTRRQVEYPDRDSDSGSDNADEQVAQRLSQLSMTSSSGGSMTPVHGRNVAPASPAIAVHQQSTPSRRATTDAVNPLDDMEQVFDIVFRQQAIGMKLGSDESKQYAVVKECFDGSEAKQYPEIQNGVVILAVNGQEVSGVGLSRVLYRLREAPRPVVVRFGRISKHHGRTGTWG